MEPAKPRLRKVDATVPGTWACITALDAECFSDGSPALESNAGGWWIAYVRGANARQQVPVGYCGIRQGSAGNDVGYMCRAGILPAFRGRGLQKTMIRARLVYAREQGWKVVVSDTHGNLPSANSLIACGFRLYKPDVKWAYETSLYWKKTL